MYTGVVRPNELITRLSLAPMLQDFVLVLSKENAEHAILEQHIDPHSILDL